MRASVRPQARTDGLVVKALPDEVLVYDLTRHRTHCLNGPAAAVWRLCDGGRTLTDIARQIEQAGSACWNDDAVRLALDQLSRAELLTDTLPTPTGAGGLTRRQTLQRLAAAAAVVPTVATIVAPRAAQAQSIVCVDGNQPCTSAAQCCAGICAEVSCTCENLGNGLLCVT